MWPVWIIEKRQKAKARRDSDGTPVCGACREGVHEKARVCPYCGSKLFTRRGIMVREGSLGFALLFLFAGWFIFFDGLILEGLLSIALGLLCAYLAVQWWRDRPIREVQFFDRLPFS